MMFRFFKKDTPNDAETASNRLKGMVKPKISRVKKDIEKLLSKFYDVKEVKVTVHTNHLKVDADI
ncbi:hypothetical protein OAT84_02140 [Gammaproteobacteria bacterium]|nr:hypothetical protein [Gammaproteobacteria bacterium]